jgi:hypothetical protein
MISDQFVRDAITVLRFAWPPYACWVIAAAARGIQAPGAGLTRLLAGFAAAWAVLVAILGVVLAIFGEAPLARSVAASLALYAATIASVLAVMWSLTRPSPSELELIWSAFAAAVCTVALAAHQWLSGVGLALLAGIGGGFGAYRIARNAHAKPRVVLAVTPLGAAVLAGMSRLAAVMQAVADAETGAILGVAVYAAWVVLAGAMSAPRPVTPGSSPRLLDPGGFRAVLVLVAAAIGMALDLIIGSRWTSILLSVVILVLAACLRLEV